MSTLVSQTLPWHQDAWDAITGQIDSNQLHHAYLLCAPPDTGKRHFATLLAHRLLCRSPLQGVACGTCSACQWNAVGNHPDLLIITPVEKSKVIRVEQIRDLKKYIETSSHAFGRRIVILDTAENLNASSANALLKSLEEPPENVLFLVLSDRPRSVLATISSRCLTLKLPSPPQNQALTWLQSQLPEVPREELGFALDFAQGRPYAALALLQQGEESEAVQLNDALLMILSRKEIVSKVAARYYKTHAAELLDTLAYWLSSLAKYRVSGSRHYLKGSALQQAEAVLLASHRDQGPAPRALLALYEQVIDARTQLASVSNPNLQLMLEDLLLQLQALNAVRT